MYPQQSANYMDIKSLHQLAFFYTIFQVVCTYVDRRYVEMFPEKYSRLHQVHLQV